jgi:hypothetical protein
MVGLTVTANSPADRFCYYLAPTGRNHSDNERRARQHQDRTGISIIDPSPAHRWSAARQLASPAARSAAEAVMKALFDATHASASSIETARV